MKMVKLVSESLQENVYDRLNEQMNAVNENVLADFIKAGKQLFGGLNSKYEGLNKEDDKELRQFAYLAATKTYVANNPEAGLKAFKLWAEKTDIANVKKYLEEAAKSSFAGRTAVSYVDKKPVVVWKDIATVNLASNFKSGGTGGHTASGGV